jgi:dephospho-CoA kinase
MGAWPGKVILGLTGNIATGKSVVRKMLEHLGAYGIDADALAHRAMAQGAPGYQPVVDAFGQWIIGSDGQIDRSRLGRVVFSDAAALARLEAILHPLVRQAIDLLVRRAPQKVIVIEAIKLLEGPLNAACDSIWVTTAPYEVQVARLVQKRGLTPETARQRIHAQAPQEAKLAQAQIVIHNAGSFEDTWRQVQAGWLKVLPGIGIEPPPVKPAPGGQTVVERAGPRQAQEIADLVTRLSKGRHPMTREDAMAAFGEKAFLLLRANGRLIGMAGWQVENLVARTSDLYLEPGQALGEMMRILMDAIERASDELQCEVVLMFLPPHLARQETVWNALGYTLRAPQNLGVRAWQEAAVESMPPGTVMLFKQLRTDRVLRPI